MINPYVEEEPAETVLSLKQVLQAFVGSPGLPRDIDNGLLLFEHNNSLLSTVNTCAPSITLRGLDKIQKYQMFQDDMLNLIVCSYGFGLE